MANFVSPNQIQIQIGLFFLVRPDTCDDTSQPCLSPSRPLTAAQILLFDTISNHVSCFLCICDEVNRRTSPREWVCFMVNFKCVPVSMTPVLDMDLHHITSTPLAPPPWNQPCRHVSMEGCFPTFLRRKRLWGQLLGDVNGVRTRPRHVSNLGQGRALESCFKHISWQLYCCSFVGGLPGLTLNEMIIP